MSYVHQPRPNVHKGQHGGDIRAYKRALKAAGYHDPRFVLRKNTFGDGMLQMVEHFQRDRDLTADGVIGPKTYAHMYPFFDATAFWFLLNPNIAIPPPPESMRQRIGDEMDHAVAHHSVYVWAEVRPIPVNRIRDHDYRFTIYTDCSGITIGVNAAAGAPDPSGNGYNGAGNTASFLGHLKHIEPSQMKLADIIVFGSYPGKHAVSVRAGAPHIRDYQIMSLGHNGGEPDEPAYYPLARMLDYFSADPYYCLSLGL